MKHSACDSDLSVTIIPFCYLKSSKPRRPTLYEGVAQASTPFLDAMPWHPQICLSSVLPQQPRGGGPAAFSFPPVQISLSLLESQLLPPGPASGTQASLCTEKEPGLDRCGARCCSSGLRGLELAVGSVRVSESSVSRDNYPESDCILEPQ